MDVKGDTLHRILERHDSYVAWCAKYGEPGYTDPENGILFANWNNVPRRLADWLESHGYALEWSDEWTICYDSGYAYRTSPDSYWWRQSFVYTDDGELIGLKDIKNGDMLDEYESYLLNDPRKCATMPFPFEARGFEKINRDSYESGLHPGQNDDPANILRTLESMHPDMDFIFTLDEASQFYLTFSIYGRRRRDSEEDSEDNG